MKAKKSKGDGVFNKKNGFVNEKGSMKGTPKVVQSMKKNSLKNTGDSHCVDMPVKAADMMADGHKKLSGSLMSDLQGPGQMMNVDGKNKMDNSKMSQKPMRKK